MIFIAGLPVKRQGMFVPEGSLLCPMLGAGGRAMKSSLCGNKRQVGGMSRPFTLEEVVDFALR